MEARKNPEAIDAPHVRSIYLILIMAAITVIVLGSTIAMLYRAAFDEERARLVEVAQSRARMIEAMARFDRANHAADPVQAVLAQLREAHRRFAGFGKTGDFTLGMRQGDHIVFLLNHHHSGLGKLQPVPFDGTSAAPMRHALQGEAGWLVGPDYRGETVLAAYEPVEASRLGIVAKIDLQEVRAPFIRAAWASGAIAFVLVLFGAWSFRRITRRVGHRVERSEKLFRDTFAHAGIGLAHVATDGTWLRVNDALCDILGYDCEELHQRSFRVITHPDDLDTGVLLFNKALAGDIDTYSMDQRYIRKDGATVDAQVTVSLVRNSGDEADYFIAAVADISQLKQAMATIKTISGIVPLCAWCGNSIRNEDGDWVRVDSYIEKHSDAQISHGMCPSCKEALTDLTKQGD